MSALRFAHRPVDPRSRLVVSAEPGRRRRLLHLECGHTASRHFVEVPERVICTRCPAAGGLGGHIFEVRDNMHFAGSMP